jgi:hypothetical protein
MCYTQIDIFFKTNPITILQFCLQNFLVREKYTEDYNLFFRQVVIRMVKLCVVLPDRLCGNNPRTEEVLNSSVQYMVSSFSAP